MNTRGKSAYFEDPKIKNKKTATNLVVVGKVKNAKSEKKFTVKNDKENKRKRKTDKTEDGLTKTSDDDFEESTVKKKQISSDKNENSTRNLKTDKRKIANKNAENDTKTKNSKYNIATNDDIKVENASKRRRTVAVDLKKFEWVAPAKIVSPAHSPSKRTRGQAKKASEDRLVLGRRKETKQESEKNAATNKTDKKAKIMKNEIIKVKGKNTKSRTTKNSGKKKKKAIDDDEEEEEEEEEEEGDDDDNSVKDEDFRLSDEGGDDDDSDWEEVKVAESEVLLARVKGGGARRSTKQQHIQVTIHNNNKNRKLTKAEMFHDAVRCAINRSRSTSQQQVQQIHVLCLLSHGRHLSLYVCNHPLLQATLLSLTHPDFPAKDLSSWNPHSLLKFTSWFHTHYACSLHTFVSDLDCLQTLVERLLRQAIAGKVSSAFEHNLLFVTSLRSMGLKTRLMHAFEPITQRPRDLIKRADTPANLVQAVFRNQHINPSATNNNMNNNNDNNKKNKSNTNSSDDGGVANGNFKSDNKGGKKKKGNGDEEEEEEDDDDDDDDYYDDHYYRKNTRAGIGENKKNKNKNNIGNKKSRVGLFSWWAEVFLESEKKWIYANSVSGKVGGVKDVQSQASIPFSYVLAHHPEGHVKDLTSKYDADWLVQTSKRRLGGDWWTEMMMIFKDNQSLMDTVEDVQIDDMLKSEALPTNFAAYKNHPFYVIDRHLLKYEVLVPRQPAILGHVKGEPVYARSAVKMCHSKDKWMLEGRAVKRGEEPYKVVKAIRRQNEPEGLIRWQELYGMWQTEKYHPPPAVDGKIVKNRFGNIELFQPWMLPAGTVHIRERMLGLGRVAEKMGKEVAPAMLGWHFKKGFNIPIVQGWVVCQEDKDVLVSAWWQEQKQLLQKLKEKRRKAVYARWRRMTLALINRHRLMAKYDVKF